MTASAKTTPADGNRGETKRPFADSNQSAPHHNVTKVPAPAMVPNSSPPLATIRESATPGMSVIWLSSAVPTAWRRMKSF
jgi:hypothetical protein